MDKNVLGKFLGIILMILPFTYRIILEDPSWIIVFAGILLYLYSSKKEKIKDASNKDCCGENSKEKTNVKKREKAKAKS